MIISQRVTERENISIVNKQKVADGFSIDIFAFEHGAF